MKKVLIFAGTTEGRELAEILASASYAGGTYIATSENSTDGENDISSENSTDCASIMCSVCVATGYARELMDDDRLDVHCGRLTEDDMEALMLDGGYDAVVDATHPYAQIVSQNVRQAANHQSIPLIHLRRITENTEKDLISFQTHRECSEWLSRQTGNILLTTGSKDLGVYAADEAIKKRLFVRVLPGEESIRLCNAQGITGRQIIAMQGPFSERMNECILKEYSIDWMVTKISGHAGGFEEKIEAARKAGTGICAILPPTETMCQSEMSLERKIEPDVFICDNVYDTVRKLEALLKEDILSHRSRKITLAGIGMGSTESMTRESYHAFEEAEVIFGASRMLENLPGKGVKVPYYRADDIISYLIAHPEYIKAAVAFSGDSGFYSGAQAMVTALEAANKNGALKSETTVLPGISSISALAARLRVSWGDAVLASIHGRQTNVIRIVRENQKVFLLLSGKKDFKELCSKFHAARLDQVKFYAGYRLSYPDEKLFVFSPYEFYSNKSNGLEGNSNKDGLSGCNSNKNNLDENNLSEDNSNKVNIADKLEIFIQNLPDGVYTCLIENKSAIDMNPILTPGIADEVFSRTKVPMTKNEIRVLSISRLELTRHAIVYDVGSGTGSVSAECARLSPDIHVFAIEQKEEAANLTKENMELLGLADQVTVIHKKAPEGFEKLPMPTHVFIGGSSGALSDILSAIQIKMEQDKQETEKEKMTDGSVQKYAHEYPSVRVVINAVSLETIAQITELIEQYPVENVQITQIQASRAHKLGHYNLMQAQNPVLIASFDLMSSEAVTKPEKEILNRWKE